MSIPIEFNPMGREGKVSLPYIDYRFRSFDWPTPVISAWKVWDNISVITPPEGHSIYSFRFHVKNEMYTYCRSDQLPDWYPGDLYIPSGVTEFTYNGPDSEYIFPAVMETTECEMDLTYDNFVPPPEKLHYILRVG